MTKLQRLALLPLLLLGLAMSALALLAPARIAVILGGFEATGPVGSATLHADLTAYFSIFTIGIIAAMFANKQNWLWAPLGLFGITGIVRIIHGLMSGFSDGAAQPILIEIVSCGLILFAMRRPRLA